MIAIPNIEKPKKGEVIAFDGECAVYTDDDMQVHRYPLIDIVRCGECKWAEKEGDESEGYLTCACHIPRFFVPEDGFCFLGERRSE